MTTTTNTIKSIRIENFQAHKDLQLDFGKQITSITGPSDRGKSAILRALVWVITNRPGGDNFIRYGAEECRVTVQVGEHTVQRIKGKKRNLYILDNVEFKALKSDVPEEIQKLFNIGPNNIQSQFDPIFWFSETAGEVGRNLKQIVNLDVIDYVLGNIQSRYKQVKTEVDVLENMITEQEKALENADAVESVLGVIHRVEGFQLELDKLQTLQESLEEAIDRAETLDGWLQRAQKWEETYHQLESLMDGYIETVRAQTSLETLIGDVQELSKTIGQQVVPDTMFTIVARIEEGEKELREMRRGWKNLNAIVEDIGDTSRQVEQYEQQAKAAEEEFHGLLDKNVCPLCGRGGKQ